MSNQDITVEVPTDQYAVPEQHDDGTIEIGVAPFDESVYLEYPRFDRTGTNNFCVNAQSLFNALIDVQSDATTLKVEPVIRKLGVLDTDSSLSKTKPDTVSTDVIGNKATADHEHLKVIEEFTTTIGDITEDPYWNGYKAGARTGSGSFTWSQIAWRAFDNEWDGNSKLMLEVGQWLAQKGWAVCERSNAMFPIPQWTRKSGAYVSTVSEVFDGTCPSCGANKDNHWSCISSSNSTRRANKYKCDSCGHTATGITTG